MILTLLGLFAAGLAAGAQNALAGGGSFLTLPALMLAGLDARAANIASSIALWPGQLTAGYAGRHNASPLGSVSLPVLAAVSLAGGAAGAILLLATPSRVFATLVPWLILAATLIFAWGSLRKPKPGGHTPPAPAVIIAIQTLLAIYGGYFGGGMGILMMAAYTMSGLSVRAAGATKNLLNGVLNTTAVLIFALRGGNNWAFIAALATGAILGGQLGVRLMNHVNDRALRLTIIAIGLTLTLAMFLRV